VQIEDRVIGTARRRFHVTANEQVHLGVGILHGPEVGLVRAVWNGQEGKRTFTYICYSKIYNGIGIYVLEMLNFKLNQYVLFPC
jgi:hypothetical protein